MTDTIRVALRMMGISDLQLKFNAADGVIVAKFRYFGQRTEKTITFLEIEQMFCSDQPPESSLTALASPRAAAQSPQGSKL